MPPRRSGRRSCCSRGRRRSPRGRSCRACVSAPRARYRQRMAPDQEKRSLQDVLRARRESASLVTPGEAARREAARKREGAAAQAVEAVERWRDGRSPDGSRKLEPAVYAELFRLSPAAYYASGHWSRRARTQLASAPACEVRLCAATAGAAAHHLNHDALGSEQAGRDLITLCAGCHRRAEK